VAQTVTNLPNVLESVAAESAVNRWRQRWASQRLWTLPEPTAAAPHLGTESVQDGALSPDNWPRLETLTWQAGHRRCVRLEDVSLADAETLAASWRERGACAGVSSRRYGLQGGSANRDLQGSGRTTVWLAHTAQDLAEALAWDHTEVAAADPTAREAATRALGALLGYPTCCTEAFLQLPDPGDNDSWWRCIAGTAAVEPAPWTANPFAHLERLFPWFPCSLHCEPTRTAASQTVALLRADFPVALGLLQATMQVAVVVPDSGGLVCCVPEAKLWWVAPGNGQPKLALEQWALACLAGELLSLAVNGRVALPGGDEAWLVNCSGACDRA
jgi:hypothetical protein